MHSWYPTITVAILAYGQLIPPVLLLLTIILLKVTSLYFVNVHYLMCFSVTHYSDTIHRFPSRRIETLFNHVCVGVVWYPGIQCFCCAVWNFMRVAKWDDKQELHSLVIGYTNLCGGWHHHNCSLSNIITQIMTVGLALLCHLEKPEKTDEEHLLVTAIDTDIAELWGHGW